MNLRKRSVTLDPRMVAHQAVATSHDPDVLPRLGVRSTPGGSGRPLGARIGDNLSAARSRIGYTRNSCGVDVASSAPSLVRWPVSSGTLSTAEISWPLSVRSAEPTFIGRQQSVWNCSNRKGLCRRSRHSHASVTAGVAGPRFEKLDNVPLEGASSLG
jgi:hypothetical protein